MKSAPHQALRLLGYVWSLPYAVVGLVGAAVFLALGWVDAGAWREGALELACRGRFARWMTTRNWCAFTLGWTIFFWQAPYETIQRHEHRHVDQALVLGAFYPVAYLVALALRGYRANWFEVDARRAAGQDKAAQSPTTISSK
jgi:hypothetical protein